MWLMGRAVSVRAIESTCSELRTWYAAAVQLFLAQRSLQAYTSAFSVDNSSPIVQVWPEALPGHRTWLLGQTRSACDLRKLVIYARTPAVSSTQSAGTLGCRMVGGAVLQSVARSPLDKGGRAGCREGERDEEAVRGGRGLVA